MLEILNKLPSKLDSTLVVLSEKDDKIIKATNNIKKIDIIQAKDLNALDLLSYKYLVMPKEAIKIIQETFKE